MADDVKLPGIPAIDRALPREIRSVLGPIREILVALTDGENRVSRLSDLKGAGLIEDYSAAGVKPRIDLDTTIPPAPTGLSVDAALANVILSWDVTAYKNLAFTEIWRAESNNFSLAEKVGTAQGAEAVYIDNVNHTGTWYYWIRFVSKANVTGPFNAQAGTSGTTGVNPDALLELLTGQPDSPFFNQFPFIILAVDTTINGVLCPAGVYMRDAYIANGTITNAKIANLAVDDAKIASLAAGKITAGTLAAGVIYAGNINANQVTAGTFTGLTFRTATSGQRVVINESADNKIQVYDLSGSLACQIGGGTGVVWATSSSPLQATIQGYSSGNFAGVVGSQSAAGPGVQGLSNTGYGGRFSTTNGDAGVIGTTANASSHGVRGQNTNAGTSGIVGAGVVAFDFYADGTGANYGPFTGAHDCLFPNGADMVLGDIVVDIACKARRGWSNTIFEVEHSTMPNQKSAIGVLVAIHGPLSGAEPAAFIEGRWHPTEENGLFQSMSIMSGPYYDLKDTHTLGAMNALGEGQINVCGEGGDIEAGDLIVSSSMTGKGMRQTMLTQPGGPLGELVRVADDLVRSYTVAKAREAVTFSSPEEVKTIACIYLCG